MCRVVYGGFSAVMNDDTVSGIPDDVPLNVAHVLLLQPDDGRWVDPLAVLLATDPSALYALLGAPLDAPAIVRRDVGRLGGEAELVLSGADSGAVIATALLV